MPVYCFECDKCGTKFEKKMSFESYKIPKCINCKSKTFRDYLSEDNVIIRPQNTLGSQADKNSDKFSDDYKKYLNEKHNAYKKLRTDQ